MLDRTSCRFLAAEAVELVVAAAARDTWSAQPAARKALTLLAKADRAYNAAADRRSWAHMQDFFHEIFGHRVEANRQRNVDDGQTLKDVLDASNTGKRLLADRGYRVIAVDTRGHGQSAASTPP